MTRAHKKLIDKLAALDPDRWHAVTMRMAWVYRTGGLREPPAIVLAGFAGDIPPRDTWGDIRQRVNARRKAAKAEERRYMDRQRRENRRRYMKNYMRSYRERANG